MQAGIMEEMMDDTIEGIDEDEELEEAAEEEVERVLYEITDGKLGVAGAGKELPVRREVFLALHCWVLMRIIEPQRRRGGSSQRSGDGTYAGTIKQPADWIIEALRANVLAYLPHPHDYFQFLFTFISCSLSLLYTFHLIENPRQHFCLSIRLE